MSDLIDRQAVIDKINERQRKLIYCFGFENDAVKILDIAKSIISAMPSAQSKQRPLTEDNYAYCAKCDSEVKCLSCGHHIAERPFEVYCNIMCKWVNEKDYCTMFELGQEKKPSAQPEIIRCKD